MAARDNFTRVGLGLWFHDQGIGFVGRTPCRPPFEAPSYRPPEKSVLAPGVGLERHRGATTGGSSCGMHFYRRRLLSCISISISLGTGRSTAAQNHQNQRDFNVCIVDASEASARPSSGHHAAIVRLSSSYFEAACSPLAAVSAREFLGSRNTSGLTTVRWASGTWA